MKNDEDSGMFIYKIHQEKRYILEVPVLKSDQLSDMEIRLAAAKASPEHSGLNYRRLYGYKISFDGLIKQKFEPYTYFIYLRKDPGARSECFGELPEGDYICFRTKILKEEWETEILKNYFSELPKPRLILALEFEDNLVDWSDAMYEVQILI